MNGSKDSVYKKDAGSRALSGINFNEGLNSLPYSLLTTQKVDFDEYQFMDTNYSHNWVINKNTRF